MAPPKTERNKDMAAMRNAGYRLREIADKHNVSLARVQQILGNTGWTTSWKITAIRNGNEKTNEQLVACLGLSKRTISRYRGSSRHALEPGSCVYRGAFAESMVSDKMKELGISHQLMPYNSPFDILVNDKITVDVKSSYKIALSPSMIGRSISPAYNFHMRTDKKSKADFYIFVIFNDDFNDDINIFVVPSIAIPKTDTIRMAWPTMRPEIGKYQQYYNRWDLLCEASNG